MMPPSKPIVDVRNPCYLPLQPAATFLASLRSPPPASRDAYLSSFFARLLYPASDSPGPLFSWPADAGTDSSADVDLAEALLVRTTSDASTDSASSDASAYMHAPAPRPKRDAALLDNNKHVSIRRQPALVLGKRMYASLASDDSKEDSVSSTYSDLLASPRRVRSDPDLSRGGPTSSAVETDAFNLGASVEGSERGESRRETSLGLEAAADYDDDEDQCPHSPTRLVSLLASVLEDVRLADTLRAFVVKKTASVDDITALLCKEGKVGQRVLRLLGKAPISTLDLAPSLDDANGLNVRGVQTILEELDMPGRFVYLERLVLDGVTLDNRDMLFLHRLPALADLSLLSTSLEDEAVFHLVALRPTLVRLSLAANKGITDDACPALALLTGLRILSLARTSVGMPGLRRLAHAEDLVRRCAMEIPGACEGYLDNLHTRYLLAPAPPLITEPSAVRSLSLTALRRNLAAHAAYNRGVPTGGPERAARARLRALLEVRKGDLGVRAMVWRAKERKDHSIESDEDDAESGGEGQSEGEMTMDLDLDLPNLDDDA